MPKDVSAGLLIYRHRAAGLEVLLVHPGGPYWAKKDEGAWSIPKGGVEPHELGVAPPRRPGEAPVATPVGPTLHQLAAAVDLLAVARRETREETGLAPEGPFQPLGGVKYRNHKFVYAWAVEHDCDAQAVVSNTFTLEWPPRSGRLQEFPEVDRAAWYDLETARRKIVPAQRRFLSDLEALAGGRSS
jgi:predicted NUDIX family NTP pyrophosphohydrolase